jgi:methylmalonyl-CoA mutase
MSLVAASRRRIRLRTVPPRPSRAPGDGGVALRRPRRAINIMRRILQASGAEVIHLGHNRSVAGDRRLRDPGGRPGHRHHQLPGRPRRVLQVHARPAAGAGRAASRSSAAAAAPSCRTEIAELHAYGIARIYSPDDGRAMGLQGMINESAPRCDFPVGEAPAPGTWCRCCRAERDPRALAQPHFAGREPPGPGRAAGAGTPRAPRARRGGSPCSASPAPAAQASRRWSTNWCAASSPTSATRPSPSSRSILREAQDRRRPARRSHPDERDRRPAGLHALAGDAAGEPGALEARPGHAIDICKAAGFDLVIVETSGIGQSDTEIVDHADVSLYVMTPEYGAASQLEKIDMLDFADVVAINKFDKRGSLDALRDVRKQYRRNHNRFEGEGRGAAGLRHHRLAVQRRRA